MQEKNRYFLIGHMDFSHRIWVKSLGKSLSFAIAIAIAIFVSVFGAAHRVVQLRSPDLSAVSMNLLCEAARIA